MRGLIDWEQVGRAELHPVRVEILDLLEMDGGRTLSATEIALELGRPLPNVNYHVTQLAQREVLVLVDNLPCRGATENFYCLARHDGADLYRRPPFVPWSHEVRSAPRG